MNEKPEKTAADSSFFAVLFVHLPFAFFAGVALLLPHLVPLTRFPSTPCLFLHLTGYPCPFCGFTRSYWWISSGHFREAFSNCPLSLVVYFCLVVIFLWNAVALLRCRVMVPERLFAFLSRQRKGVVAGIVLLFLMNWGYRLVMGLK